MNVKGIDYHEYAHECKGDWAIWSNPSNPYYGRQAVLIVGYSLGATYAFCVLGVEGGVLAAGSYAMAWLPTDQLEIGWRGPLHELEARQCAGW
jgi:hypothetical protein